jgi:chromosome segregation ATPase|tara:strand:+ start:2228 stop:2455 length:228 start_codon:yes stop_codon:yes gene_type:complete
MDDVYLNNFSKDLQEAIRKKTRKKYKHKDEIEMLTKQKEYLQNQLRKAGEEIKNLKAEVKYERELRLKGAKYHNG